MRERIQITERVRFRTQCEEALAKFRPSSSLPLGTNYFSTAFRAQPLKLNNEPPVPHYSERRVYDPFRFLIIRMSRQARAEKT